MAPPPPLPDDDEEDDAITDSATNTQTNPRVAKVAGRWTPEEDAELTSAAANTCPVLKKDVSQRWKTVYQETIPGPPLILLVDNPVCWENEFWFQAGDEWRDYIAGIGCEKSCLLADEGKVVQDKAEEYNLVLHPWTERLEHKYVFNQSI
jgi:hypothetical protein